MKYESPSQAENPTRPLPRLSGCCLFWRPSLPHRPSRHGRTVWPSRGLAGSGPRAPLASAAPGPGLRSGRGRGQAAPAPPATLSVPHLHTRPGRPHGGGLRHEHRGASTGPTPSARPTERCRWPQRPELGATATPRGSPPEAAPHGTCQRLPFLHRRLATHVQLFWLAEKW